MVTLPPPVRPPGPLLSHRPRTPSPSPPLISVSLFCVPPVPSQAASVFCFELLDCLSASPSDRKWAKSKLVISESDARLYKHTWHLCAGEVRAPSSVSMRGWNSPALPSARDDLHCCPWWPWWTVSMSFSEGVELLCICAVYLKAKKLRLGEA